MLGLELIEGCVSINLQELVDFAILEDQRLKAKESKTWANTCTLSVEKVVEHEKDGDDNCNKIPWKGLPKSVKETGGTGD